MMIGPFEISDRLRQPVRELMIALIDATLPSDPVVTYANMSRDYIGAILDGEGHIGINKIIRKMPNGGRLTERYITRAQISSIDTELVCPFLEIGGQVTDRHAGKYNAKANRCWLWSIHTQECATFLRWAAPSMRCIRKRRSAIAAIMMEFLRRRRGAFGNTGDPNRIVVQEALYRFVLKSNSGTTKCDPSHYDEELLGCIGSVLDAVIPTVFPANMEEALCDAYVNIAAAAGALNLNVAGAMRELRPPNGELS